VPTDIEQNSAGRLAALVRAFGGRRVLVVGDLIADQFVSGEISRVSREAPVMILRHERTETVPGGAANCALNLATLGARAAVVGAVGEDAAGRELLGRLTAAGVDCGGVLVAPELRTTTKVRILAGHAHSPRQQVVRLDYEAEPLTDAALLARLAESVRVAIEEGATRVLVAGGDGSIGSAASAIGPVRSKAPKKMAMSAARSSGAPMSPMVGRMRGTRPDRYIT